MGEGVSAFGQSQRHGGGGSPTDIYTSDQNFVWKNFWEEECLRGLNFANGKNQILQVPEKKSIL